MAPSQNRRELNGTLLLRDKVFKINGNANLIGSLPAKVLITFTPQDNSVPLTFQYNLETTPKGYGLVGSLSYSNRLTHFSGNATASDKFNWEINLQVINRKHLFIPKTLLANSFLGRSPKSSPKSYNACRCKNIR